MRTRTFWAATAPDVMKGLEEEEILLAGSEGLNNK